MRLIRSISSLRRQVGAWKRARQRIGFVPTMGALHAGHLSLMDYAHRENDVVVVSIFVNPKQFGPQEDFTRYPRPIKRDVFLAKQKKVDIIFYPTGKDMYPSDYRTHVTVDRLSQQLCGAFRPSHFQGVATIVCKLLHLVQPDVLYVGQKDGQQAVIIKKMITDLNLPVHTKVCPTVRELDGLALSSRNAYLSARQRQEAPILHKALETARRHIRKGKRQSRWVVQRLRRLIQDNTSGRVEYVACVDQQTLEPVRIIQGTVMIALAVWFGSTRLIDNVLVRVR